MLLGVVQGSLAARMPALKAHAGLSDALLGLALLGIPLGSILAVQFTGRWIAHRGSARVTVIGAAVMITTLVSTAWATNFALLTATLVAVGVGVGLTDTAMNAHAVQVERGYRRPIMSSFHGFASLGNLVGAAAGGAAARLAADTRLHFPLVAVVSILTLLAVRGALLPASADRIEQHTVEIPADAAPRMQRSNRWTPTLALLAAVALLAWMTEHAIADWSAVYLRDGLGESGAVATYGYALFAACMVITRFLSDRVTARIGPQRVLRWGGLIAGVGLGVGLLSGGTLPAVLGCGLVGIGMAGIVPAVFTAAGNTPGISAGHAVSKVAGVAFAGSLVGPALIGLVAEVTSLRAALLIVAVAALLIAAVGPAAVRRKA